MLSRIILKEIVAHVLSLRFAVTFVLLLLLVSASMYVSANEYRHNLAQFRAREEMCRESLGTILAAKNPESRIKNLFYWEGRSDAVPVAPLSWLGQGVQASRPASINTKAGDETRAINSVTLENPLKGLLRVPDFVYIVNVVLSFLAVLFMFDAVCGEKESGTLRLLFSNAVPRHAVLLGKWIGGTTVLLLPFLLTTVGGLVFARAQGLLPAEYMDRVVILVVVACLYVAVFFNVALFISTVTDRSATSLLACLLVWVLFILVIPNLAPVTAKILEPTPPLEMIRAQKRAVDQETRLKIERLTLTSGQLRYGQKVLEERENVEKEGARLKKQWDKFYNESRARQLDLAATLGRLSPSGCWTFAALALTGTGPDAHERLEKAKERLASEFSRLSREVWAAQEKNPSGDWAELERSDIPALRIRTPNTAEAANRALNDILILTILTVLFFMLAFMRFLRYDVR